MIEKEFAKPTHSFRHVTFFFLLPFSLFHHTLYTNSSHAAEVENTNTNTVSMMKSQSHTHTAQTKHSVSAHKSTREKYWNFLAGPLSLKLLTPAGQRKVPPAIRMTRYFASHCASNLTVHPWPHPAWNSVMLRARSARRSAVPDCWTEWAARTVPLVLLDYSVPHHVKLDVLYLLLSEITYGKWRWGV